MDTEVNMRKFRLLSAIAACIAALCMCVVPASAYLDAVDDSAEKFISDTKGWKHTTGAENGNLIEKGVMLEFVVSVKGNTELYRQEVRDAEERARQAKLTGSKEEDDETSVFTDFTGCIAVGAETWEQFDFETLSTAKPREGRAGVKQLGDDRYLLYADLSGKRLVSPIYGTSINIMEWENTSDEYCLHVDEVYLYNVNKEVILYYDGLGNVRYDHEPFARSVFAGEPEPVVTEAPKPAATQAPEESPEVANAVTEPAKPAPAVANTDYGSRDESLITISIVAASVIVVLVVIIVLVMKKINK